MKVGVIILCRYSSSRLPGKILMEVKGRAILENIYLRLNESKTISSITVATSQETSDDIIAGFCEKHGIPIFRGDLQNVAKRFLDCAKANDLDYAIRINGDNVFVDIDTLDKMTIETLENKARFSSNVPGRTFPFGMSIEIVNTEFYETCYQQFSSPDHFEHVTKFIYDEKLNSEGIHLYRNVEYPELQGIQLAVDTQEDLEKARRITQSLKNFPISYTMKSISTLIREEL